METEPALPDIGWGVEASQVFLRSPLGVARNQAAVAMSGSLRGLASSAPTAPMVTKSSASPQSMLVMMRFTPFSDSGSPWTENTLDSRLSTQR